MLESSEMISLLFSYISSIFFVHKLQNSNCFSVRFPDHRPNHKIFDISDGGQIINIRVKF